MPLLSSLGLKPPRSKPPLAAPPEDDDPQVAQALALRSELAQRMKDTARKAAQLQDAAARAGVATALKEADAARKKAEQLAGNPALKSEALQAAIKQVKAVAAQVRSQLAAAKKADSAAPEVPGTAAATVGTTSEPTAPQPTPPQPKPVKLDKKVTAQAIRGDGRYGLQLDGSASRETDDGKGNKTKVTGAFGGKVWYESLQVPYVDPKQFDITFHLDTSLGGSGSNEGRHASGVGVSANASLTAEFKFTHVRRLGEKDAKAYTEAIQAGNGGSGKWKEIKAAELVLKGAYTEAKGLLKQVGTVIEGGALNVDDLQDGDSKDLTGSVKAQGEVGGTVNAGVVAVTLKAGISRNGSISREVRRVGANYEITLSCSESGGTQGTVGGAVDGVGMKHKRTHEESSSEEVRFFIDAADPQHNQKIQKIFAAADASGLQALRSTFKDIVSVGRKTHGRVDGADTSASVADAVSLRTSDVSALGESVIEGPDGAKTVIKTGQGVQGMDLSAKGERLVSTRTNEIYAGAGADNKGFGRSQSRSNETDLVGSAKGVLDAVVKRDMATLKAMHRGDKKVLKEVTSSEGVVLSDASFAKLAEAARDASSWKKELLAKGWDADAETVKDWMALRGPMQQAGEDRVKIADLLTRFESKPGRGRHQTVRVAVGATGSGFEFPKSLASKQPIYDNLVTADPVAPALNAGDTAACLAKLKAAQQQLDGLRKDILACVDGFKSEGDKHEMLDRIDERRAEIRKATEKLTGRDGTSETQEQGRIAMRIKDLKEKIADAALREQQTFTQWEQDAKGSFFGGVDIVKLDAHMKLLRGLYPKWDRDVQTLRQLLTDAGPGFDPATADTHLPNRARYRQLRAKTPDASGSMASDGV